MGLTKSKGVGGENDGPQIHPKTTQPSQAGPWGCFWVVLRPWFIIKAPRNFHFTVVHLINI